MGGRPCRRGMDNLGWRVNGWMDVLVRGALVEDSCVGVLCWSRLCQCPVAAGGRGGVPDVRRAMGEGATRFVQRPFPPLLPFPKRSRAQRQNHSVGTLVRSQVSGGVALTTPPWWVHGVPHVQLPCQPLWGAPPVPFG